MERDNSAGKVIPAFSPQWIKIVIPAIALLLGALQAIVCRHTMDPDGISYLDMGDALLRGDWQTGVNSYWSPLYPIIQASGLHVVHPSGYWQFSVVHFTNFIIYVLALGSFHFYWDRVMASHFRQLRAGSWQTSWQLAWWLLGYALFTWATLQLITVSRVNPDLMVAALVFLASGLLVSIRTGKATYGNFALLGLVLALGYLTKTAMFPLAFVFLGVGLLCVGDLRRAAPRVLLATTLFVGVTAPWLAAISHSKGRLTFGTTGGLNYAWNANGILQHSFADILLVPRGNLVHPARKMLEDPPVYRFGGPIKTSYPFWYDPSYWCEGLKARFQLRG